MIQISSCTQGHVHAVGVTMAIMPMNSSSNSNRKATTMLYQGMIRTRAAL